MRMLIIGNRHGSLESAHCSFMKAHSSPEELSHISRQKNGINQLKKNKIIRSKMYQYAQLKTRWAIESHRLGLIV